MEFAELEARDGIRFPWNVWPSNRLDAVRNVIPLGCFVTPLKAIEGMPVLPYDPVRCKCQAVLNPYCSVDFASRTWICPICLARNPFPPQYAQIHEGHQPAELYPQYTAVEYVLPQPVQFPLAVLLVVDMCVEGEDLQDLKSALKQVLSLLPDQCLVGLLTFGALVALHELSSEMPKAYVFRGDQALSGQEIAKMLHLALSRSQQKVPGQSPHTAPGQGIGRFLLPLGDCEFVLESIIDDLQADEQWKEPGMRPIRATGAALSVAVGLLENSLSGSGAQILVFTSGPGTLGPGQVVGRDQAEALRSHRDFEKGSVKQFMRSVKHYDGLADRMNRAGHSLHVFACSLDQVGLAEMHPAVHYTGGTMMMAETYGHESFHQSLARFLERDANDDLQMAFNATTTLLCSSEVMIQGASGPCASLKREGPQVSGNQKMAGGTNAWQLSCAFPTTTLCVFLEVGPVGNQRIPEGKHLHLQFATAYQHASGQRRLRVVTTARSWAEPKSEQIAAGFDQEAAMAMLARLTIFKLMEEESLDVLRWLDRSLIKLAARFAGYTKDQADTFQLPPNFSLMPQWVFNLRRSPFMQVFGHSPDETAFFRLMLDREGVAGALTMIQPQLFAYGFGQPPRPVLLDVQSVRPDEVLLLDAFFMVVVHCGSTVAQWRKAGYHRQEEHQAFRELLAAPLEEARGLLKGRYPVPKLLEVDQGGSQARFLLARLNPSVTHNRSAAAAAAGSEIIFSEDVALDVFLDSLARLAVVD